MNNFTNSNTPMSQELFDHMRNSIDKKWSDEQILSTWYLFILKNTNKSNINVKRVDVSKVDHENILLISKKYDVAPLVLVRKVLKFRGFHKRQIKNYINTPTLAVDYVDEYKMIILALENDADNPLSYKFMADKSREYENEVEDILRNIGLKFKTQSELVKEQQDIYGRAVLTPDFLFLEPIIVVVKHPDGGITDHIINWIDAKNYMYVTGYQYTKNIREQAAKYVKHFGPGALLFHYGFDNSLKIPGTVLLSGSKKLQLNEN
jgi:hypothetical protein